MKKVSKQQAAKRQLDAGIKWFFQSDDNLPIFNIASDVFMITENLAEKSGLDKTMFAIIKEVLTPTEFGDIKNQMGQKPGFLKHANRPVTEMNDVSDNEVLSMLCMAVENYSAVFKEISFNMGLLKAYFIIFIIGMERARVRGIDPSYLEALKPFNNIYKEQGSDGLKSVLLHQILSKKS